jgi:hypothetical protein
MTIGEREINDFAIEGGGMLRKRSMKITLQLFST